MRRRKPVSFLEWLWLFISGMEWELVQGQERAMERES